MTEPRIIKIDKHAGMHQFEQYMHNIQQGDTVLQVSVPHAISHAGNLGRSVSFAQLIATWADSSTQRLVKTNLQPPDQSPDQSKYEKFVSHLHGLTVAYYANRITAVDGTTNLRRHLLNVASPRIHAMHERQLQDSTKGQTVELVFVHHARLQFHPSVYRRQPGRADIMDRQSHGELIVSSREMNAFILNALKTVNVRSKDSTRLDQLLNEHNHPLGQLLHEAFRNTAEHAYLDLKGRVPQKGLRCVLISVRSTHSAELQPAALVSGEHPQLDPYFQGLRDRADRGQRKLVSVLELSVFDSGPGFADTLQHSDADDAKRVARCFEKHVSSKPGPNSGLGLGRVLGLVGDLDGFVRFRTSTTEAFFSSRMGTPPIPHVAGNLPKAIGTALTIGIPLAL